MMARTPLVLLLLLSVAVGVTAQPALEMVFEGEFNKLWLQHPADMLVVSVDRVGRIFIREEEVHPDELGYKLKTLAKGPEQRIFLRGDERADYFTVTHVI